VTVRYASALIGLVVLVGFLVPDGPLGIDERWSELMQDAESSWWTHLALVFDAFGHGILRWLTIAGVGLVLLIGNRRAALLAFALAEALTPLLVNVIKLLIGRERPTGAMIEAHGSSYPSGHAAYAGATAVMLVLLFTTPGRFRVAGWVVAALLTAGMAWSRTYLQAHWLVDSVAGAALGVGVALLSLASVQILSTRTRERDAQRSGPISERASSISS
jgi:undecaprenyl-diphosphatase